MSYIFRARGDQSFTRLNFSMPICLSQDETSHVHYVYTILLCYRASLCMNVLFEIFCPCFENNICLVTLLSFILQMCLNNSNFFFLMMSMLVSSFDISLLMCSFCIMSRQLILRSISSILSRILAAFSYRFILACTFQMHIGGC